MEPTGLLQRPRPSRSPKGSERWDGPAVTTQASRPKTRTSESETDHYAQANPHEAPADRRAGCIRRPIEGRACGCLLPAEPRQGDHRGQRHRARPLHAGWHDREGQRAGAGPRRADRAECPDRGQHSGRWRPLCARAEFRRRGRHPARRRRWRCQPYHATTIGGNLQLDANGSRLEAQYNTIDGDLQAFSNRGGLVIRYNTIDGNLQCKSNRPAPIGASNWVSGNKEDHCARL